jgi:hypothetical protein
MFLQFYYKVPAQPIFTHKKKQRPIHKQVKQKRIKQTKPLKQNQARALAVRSFFEPSFASCCFSSINLFVAIFMVFLRALCAF